jgi:HAD superfamily hydrolase (TIGR01509 family)
MLDQLEVKPGQAIFVDDLQENIDAAEQLGIHGVVFWNAQQAISDVRQLLS